MRISQFLSYLCVLFLLGACFTKHTKNLPSDIPPAATQATLSAPAEQPGTEASSDTPVAADTTKNLKNTSVKNTTTEEQNASVPTEQVLAQVQVKFNVPLADTPQFKDEELISLEDRHLHPYIFLPFAEQAPQTAPWANEQLKFGLYYSFVKAGTAYIKNRGMVDVNGRPAYLIQTSAFSAPVIDTVFKVRDINFSWLDANQFYSLGYAQSLREGNYKRDEWVVFDYDKNNFYGSVKKKNEPRTFSGELSALVLDMLSALYYVRAQQTLQPGQEIIFDIINREEQYPLVVKVLKRETVKTPAGKFKCIVVEPQFRGEGIFVSKGKSLKVWLTDDAYKMPVKMKTEVFIGSVSADLLEYKRN